MIKSINYFKLKDSEFENIKKMPLYKKAMDIFELCDSITSIVFNKDENSKEFSMLNETAKHMMDNAIIIPAKISGCRKWTDL